MRIAACRLCVIRRGSVAVNVQFVTLFVLFLLLINVPGCRKSSGKVSVHGRVSYQGAPLESAALTFFPASGRPETVTVSNGEYTADLAPGDYSAIVLIGVDLPKGYKEGDPVPPPKIVLPETYTSRAKSTLKATVAAGQSEPINFELK